MTAKRKGADKKKKPHASFTFRNWHAYTLLIIVSILVRIPFLKTFDMVAYDGTYYINQARSLLEGAYRASVFPIGYPVFIALLIPVVRDGVLAARIVSVLASFGSLIVFYELCKRFVERRYALVAALVLALTPLFVRLSMMTLSESIYILWMLLGFLLFARGRELYSGLFMGMAAITRPEALGILGVLGILRLRRPRRLLLMAAGFLVAYSINVAVQSRAAGELVLLPKAKLFGTGAMYWKLREGWVEFSGKEQVVQEMSEEVRESGVAADYAGRLPRELLLLIRHVMPVAFAMAVYGVYRRRLFLLASFVPFVFFPLFTLRSETRFVLPYVPALVLYSVLGVQSVVRSRVRTTLLVLLVLSAAAGFAVNFEQFVAPVSEYYEWSKELGLSFRGRVEPGDRIGDRKPYFAFYAGGEYVEIPIGPYDETIAHLAAGNVRYLVLHMGTIHSLRRRLFPLVTNKAVMNGELRYFPTLFWKDVAVFELVRDADPLTRRELVAPGKRLMFGTSWSPDGEKIALRMNIPSGEGGLYVVAPGGGEARRILDEPWMEDPICWAPDSRRIAFASERDGNIDIFMHDPGGGLERITSHPADDRSPSWSGDGTEIFFCSNRSGSREIWSKNLVTGECTQLTTGGGYGYPAVSPDGARVAWIRENEGLYIHNRSTGEVTRAALPENVLFVPAWSPDGSYIAVAAKDIGKADVYLLTEDAGSVVLLTKSVRNEGMPAWSPDGRSIATVTNLDDDMGLWVLTGIEPYLERLLHPVVQMAK